MFRSEEAKMKLYRANLAREAKNQFIQGEKLDEYLLYEKGIEAQEKGTTRFAEAIGEQIGKNMRVVGTVDKIKSWAGADDGADDVDEYGSVLKAKSKNPPKSIKQPSKPRKMISNNRELENEMMGMEDINLNALVPSSTKATEAQTKAQADAQAQLDLIALFQQDVKEGRKRQALKDLAQLNQDEDKRLRQKFMRVLEELESKKQSQEEKAILDKMMSLIEKQRIYDSFLEFSEINMTNEVASKLQRNLVAAMSNKKFLKRVAHVADTARRIKKMETKAKIMKNYSVYGNDMQNRNEMEEEDNLSKKLRAGTTIAERMTELRARNKKKRSNSTSSSVSTAPLSNGSEGSIGKMDLRAFNSGKKNDTNVELNSFTDLLSAYDSSKGNRRKEINQQLNNIISRQSNKKIADRMKDMKSAFHRR